VERCDLQPFAEAIQRLCNAFNRAQSDGLIDTYWRALAHLPARCVISAVDICVKSGTFFPTPKALIDVASPLVKPAMPPSPNEELRGFSRAEIREMAAEMSRKHQAAFGTGKVGGGLSTIGASLMGILPKLVTFDRPGEPIGP